jgi:hypothetical protein
MANAHESQLTFGQNRHAVLHSSVNNVALTIQVIGRMLIYTMCRKATASSSLPMKYPGNSAHCPVGIWARAGGDLAYAMCKLAVQGKRSRAILSEWSGNCTPSLHPRPPTKSTWSFLVGLDLEASSDLELRHANSMVIRQFEDRLATERIVPCQPEGDVRLLRLYDGTNDRPLTPPESRSCREPVLVTL